MASFVGISAFFFDGSGRHHVQTLVGKHTGSGTRPEIVPTAQLQPMMVELLQHFRERAGTEARRVLFYRDGVGDSQFGDVMLHEVSTLCAFMHAFTPCTLSISCTSTCACQGATTFESHYLYVLLH